MTEDEIRAASEAASEEAFPNFHGLRGRFESGFVAGAHWALEHPNGIIDA